MHNSNNCSARTTSTITHLTIMPFLTSTSEKCNSRNPILTALRTIIVYQLIAIGALTVFLTVLTYLLVVPPFGLWTPLSINSPYAHLSNDVHSIYHDPSSRSSVFSSHRDRISDWSVPPTPVLFALWEKSVDLLEVYLPTRLVPPPIHLVHIMTGPAKYQMVRSVILLGIPDLLADRVMSLHDLHQTIISPSHQSAQAKTLRSGLMPNKDGSFTMPDFSTLSLSKLERLMAFALSVGFFQEVAYAGSHIYINNALSVTLRNDHPNNQNALLLVNSNEFYLAMHHLLDGLLTPDDTSAIDDLMLNSFSRSGNGKSDLSSRRERAIQSQVKTLQSLGTSPSSESSFSNAWSSAFGEPTMWSLYKRHPTLESNFAQAMSDVDRLGNHALVEDYEWSRMKIGNGSASVPIHTLVDLGGSTGSFLSAVLASHSSINRGVLFDLPTSIAQTAPSWNVSAMSSDSPKVNVAKKTTLVGGDFFNISSLPQPSSQGATRYILRQILHDWSDRDSMVILQNLRQVMGDRKDVSIVLIEMNRSPSQSAPLAHIRHWTDLGMIICCNAAERTSSTWEVILRASGWKLVRTAPARSVYQIMEIRPIENESEITAVGTETGVHQEL